MTDGCTTHRHTYSTRENTQTRRHATQLHRRRADPGTHSRAHTVAAPGHTHTSHRHARWALSGRLGEGGRAHLACLFANLSMNVCTRHLPPPGAGAAAFVLFSGHSPDQHRGSSDAVGGGRRGLQIRGSRGVRKEGRGVSCPGRARGEGNFGVL